MFAGPKEQEAEHGRIGQREREPVHLKRLVGALHRDGVEVTLFPTAESVPLIVTRPFIRAFAVACCTKEKAGRYLINCSWFSCTNMTGNAPSGQLIEKGKPFTPLDYAAETLCKRKSAGIT